MMPRALRRADPRLHRLNPCQWGRASSCLCALGPEAARSIKCLSRLAASANLDVNLVFISEWFACCFTGIYLSALAGGWVPAVRRLHEFVSRSVVQVFWVIVVPQ
jgi:hypothetical protein